MSTPKVPRGKVVPLHPQAAPLTNVTITSRRGDFTLAGQELANVVGLAERRGTFALIDPGPIHMELRGLAVLVGALGDQTDTRVDEEYAFWFIDQSLQHMAARLEASGGEYTATIADGGAR